MGELLVMYSEHNNVYCSNLYQCRERHIDGADGVLNHG